MAAQAVNNFKAWVLERDRAGDWAEYIRGGKINRSDVAKECGFGRAAWQQNPILAEELASAEKRLTREGLIAGVHLSLDDLSPEVKAEVGASEERARRAMSARSSLEKRVKTLEEQNAVLRAANRDLTERLRRTAFAEQHLTLTGRLLPP